MTGSSPSQEAVRQGAPRVLGPSPADCLVQRLQTSGPKAGRELRQLLSAFSCPLVETLPLFLCIFLILFLVAA